MGESPNLKLISFPNVFFAFPQGKTFLVRSPPFFWREVEQEWKHRRGQEGFFCGEEGFVGIADSRDGCAVGRLEEEEEEEEKAGGELQILALRRRPPL